jgi:SAM-dependent methyltransferase
MKRTDIIQSLIDKVKAKKYLEIGVSAGENFREIKCDYKVGVDPELTSPATIFATSDDFFEKNTENFDVIFIDGLHHADQVYRDIINSLKILNPGGYIVCHDMNPELEEHQIIPFRGGIWNGDCWKAFVTLRQERDDLFMCVVDADYGCGIIQVGNQEKLVFDNAFQKLDFANFSRNRKKWLNLITPDQFASKVLMKTTGTDVVDEAYLINLLNTYIQNPDDPEINYELALFYDGIGQTAAAMSYYLRTTERSDDKLLQYECLIRASMCYDKQGTRKFTVKGLIQNAITVIPSRPEGHFLLARYYERSDQDGSWKDCYLTACVAEEFCDRNPPPLRTQVDYPGFYGILFEKAISSWWCGLCDEARDMLEDLLDNYELDELHKNAVISNLEKLTGDKSSGLPKLNWYSKKNHGKLRFKFKGSKEIEKNYAESYQDMFVLSMLNGKKNGTYLEIGAGNAFYGNNTALLETKFGWNGVALDIDENFVNAHNQERKHTCLLKDALKVNYERFLNGLDMPTDIDYLQLDCDPPEVTYKILLTMPFETHRFAVITYEHDYYCDETKSFRDKSRKYLESFGYKLVVDNISPDDNRPYEDWWVHPELVDEKIIQKMICVDGETKKAEKYMLNSL